MSNNNNNSFISVLSSIISSSTNNNNNNNDNNNNIVITFIILYVIHKGYQWMINCFHIDDGKCDTATLTLLERKTWKENVTQMECQPIVSELENAPFCENEAACAKQMSKIVACEYLKFSTLVDHPEILLRCSRGMQGSNGALWTRFTVQYNLYSGSIVAMGSDEQRQQLFDTQHLGELGCFAFTERGAGVLSGAFVETTATYDKKCKEFIIHSPTESSTKNWISQGCYAEKAVILADLILDDISYGPHLFWAQIAHRRNNMKNEYAPMPMENVIIDTNPEKTTMLGLDNATIRFTHFRIPESALLSRFGNINSSTNKYESNLPKNTERTIDLLLSRLLTGRIVLSEATLAHAMSRLQHNWSYTENRELWKGRKPKGRMMSQCSLIRITFRDYARTTAILQSFLANTRERVAEAIREQSGFTDDLIEATCMCKFLGTGFGIDCVSVIRKTMGARGLQVESMLGDESFLPNATSAAEGDNTIMELKVVQDIVRGRTSKLPWKLMVSVSGTTEGRAAITTYLSNFSRALLLGKKAIKDGQLLRDIAWSRAHLRVISNWLSDPSSSKTWLKSYGKVAMRFPVPTQM